MSKQSSLNVFPDLEAGQFALRAETCIVKVAWRAHRDNANAYSNPRKQNAEDERNFWILYGKILCGIIRMTTIIICSMNKIIIISITISSIIILISIISTLAPTCYSLFDVLFIGHLEIRRCEHPGILSSGDPITNCDSHCLIPKKHKWRSRAFILLGRFVYFLVNYWPLSNLNWLINNIGRLITRISCD